MIFSGYRVRLHFDGYSESFDFWENANSPNLFHAGWCNSKRQKLEPPKNFTGKEFKWPLYLRETDTKAAPFQVFSHRPEVTLLIICYFIFGHSLLLKFFFIIRYFIFDHLLLLKKIFDHSYGCMHSDCPNDNVSNYDVST